MIKKKKKKQSCPPPLPNSFFYFRYKTSQHQRWSVSSAEDVEERTLFYPYWFHRVTCFVCCNHSVVFIMENVHNPHGLDLLLYWEMHRFFTFPMPWDCIHSKQELTSSGYYWTGNHLRCHFCELTIEKGDVTSNVNGQHLLLSPTCTLMTNSSNNIEMCSDPTNYRYEAHRLYSFLTIDWHAPISVYDVAKWGFHFLSSPDISRCIFCRLEIRGWEENDRADLEHTRWNPHCAFMSNIRVGNVPIGGEENYHLMLMNNVSATRIPLTRPEYKNVFTYVGSARPVLLESWGVTPVETAKYPQYALYSKRLETYERWPQQMAQRPPAMCDAGLYYTTSGDRCICFWCGLGLKDWGTPDIPVEEHEKHKPRCLHLLLRSFKQHDPENIVCMTCRHCNDRDVEMVYLPCRHMVSCEKCVKNSATCIYCDKIIMAYVHVFLA